MSSELRSVSPYRFLKKGIQKVTENECSENCSISSTVWREKLTLCIALDDGETALVFLNNFWNVLDSFNEGVEDMNLKEVKLYNLFD